MDSVRIQDIPVTRIEWPDLVNAVEQAIAAREQRTISYVNVHVFNLAATHEKLRCFLQHVDICYCDGRGVQWAAWLLGDRLPQRMTGADWIEDLSAEAAQRGWRVAWIGGTPGVTQTAADRLQSRHPALQMVYTDHGYHPSDDLALIERLNAQILISCWSEWVVPSRRLGRAASRQAVCACGVVSRRHSRLRVR